ncbi:hypothetical protein AB0K48_24020 [Nonomuraea sp. NPDC055795]
MTDEMEWEERCVVYRRAKLALDRAPAASGDNGYAPRLLTDCVAPVASSRSTLLPGRQPDLQCGRDDGQ